MPTYKANPNNLPPSRMERAVQELRKAAEQVRASQAERNTARNDRVVHPDQDVGGHPD